MALTRQPIGGFNAEADRKKEADYNKTYGADIAFPGTNMTWGQVAGALGLGPAPNGKVKDTIGRVMSVQDAYQGALEAIRYVSGVRGGLPVGGLEIREYATPLFIGRPDAKQFVNQAHAGGGVINGQFMSKDDFQKHTLEAQKQATETAFQGKRQGFMADIEKLIQD